MKKEARRQDGQQVSKSPKSLDSLPWFLSAPDQDSGVVERRTGTFFFFCSVSFSAQETTYSGRALRAGRSSASRAWKYPIKPGLPQNVA